MSKRFDQPADTIPEPEVPSLDQTRLAKERARQIQTLKSIILSASDSEARELRSALVENVSAVPVDGNGLVSDGLEAFRARVASVDPSNRTFLEAMKHIINAKLQDMEGAHMANSGP